MSILTAGREKWGRDLPDTQPAKVSSHWADMDVRSWKFKVGRGSVNSHPCVLPCVIRKEAQLFPQGGDKPVVGQGSHTETILEPRPWNSSFGSLMGCPILIWWVYRAEWAGKLVGHPSLGAGRPNSVLQASVLIQASGADV